MFSLFKLTTTIFGWLPISTDWFPEKNFNEKTNLTSPIKLYSKYVIYLFLSLLQKIGVLIFLFGYLSYLLITKNIHYDGYSKTAKIASVIFIISCIIFISIAAINVSQRQEMFRDIVNKIECLKNISGMKQLGSRRSFFCFMGIKFAIFCFLFSKYLIMKSNRSSEQILKDTVWLALAIWMFFYSLLTVQLSISSSQAMSKVYQSCKKNINLWIHWKNQENKSNELLFPIRSVHKKLLVVHNFQGQFNDYVYIPVISMVVIVSSSISVSVLIVTEPNCTPPETVFIVFHGSFQIFLFYALCSSPLKVLIQVGIGFQFNFENLSVKF